MTRSCVAAMLALLAAAGCKQKLAIEKPPVPVTVALAAQRSAPYEISANGVVEPVQTVAVESQVSGLLTDVTFAEGDDVRAGQVLFRIDPRPFAATLAQAQGALARDQAQANNARREAERFKALAQKDYVTRSQADQAQATALGAQATVQADRAAVENARLNLANSTIRAPISGRTGGLLVHKGNLVKANATDPLVVINQIHPILVRFSVPQRDFPSIQRYGRGRALSVAVTPAEGSGTVEHGTLSFIDNAVDSASGTVLLKARFDNVDGSLWPGQFVQARLQLYVQQDALTVPAQAVQTGQEGTFVFVVDTGDTARTRPVSVGRALDSTAVVIEHGLRVGERVVTDGQSRLSAGARVAVRAAAGAQRAAEAAAADAEGPSS